MKHGATIKGMNQDVRDAVRQAMKERQLTQVELAQQLGMTQPALAKMLTGRTGQLPGSWQKVLDALGLRLTVEPVGDTQKKPSA